MNPANVRSQVSPRMDDGAAKSALLTRLIAYLSLCMLAAAFGGMVGPAWCRWWAIFGTFGLASATGLDVLNRSHAHLEARRRRKQLTVKTERKLDVIAAHVESSNALRDALRQLQREAADRASQDAARRAEPRLSLDRPATITPLLRCSGDVAEGMGKPLLGLVRDISCHGFGLAHDRWLERGLILLEFELENGQPIQFIADVLWCEIQDNGRFFSGGKLLEVAGPGGLAPGERPLETNPW